MNALCFLVTYFISTLAFISPPIYMIFVITIAIIKYIV